MAAKLLHSLTDDNIDLQKQIGCMTGIFQLFDRPHIRVVGKRPGVSEFNGDSLERERERNDEHLRPANIEKIPFKNMQEKQRISTESSRASFSSLSRSSSSSSLECRPTYFEPSSFERLNFSETPSRDSSTGLQNSSPQFNRQTRDLRDLVKDSMYREIHNLSIKPKTPQEAEGPPTKNRDSPRLHSDSTILETKQRMQDDLKESLKVLSKFQETPSHHNERRELFRSYSYQARDNSSSSSISRDAPRFSYDGRELNRPSLDSRDVSKSTQKLKDFPRLSLDGSKARNSYSDPKFNFLKSKDSVEFDGNKVRNLQESSGSQARPASVVAKLMGLETLPLSAPQTNTNSSVTKSYPNKEFTVISRSFIEPEANPVRLSSSWKEPNSPRWRNTDIPMKPLSRIPVEPAPWKHTDRRSHQKPRPRNGRAPVKSETAFPSVYSEIEKRLNDLEFTQSGKDLRALKQILEAMQSKKLLQSQKDSNFTSGKEQELKFKHDSRSVDRRKPQNIAARRNESPIVIMKPAKTVEGLSGVAKVHDNEFVDNRRGLSSGRAAKDPSLISVNLKSDRTLKATHPPIRSQQVAKDGLGKGLGSISPRLQQKKLELEKRARPPTPPDSSKSRRQPNKQLGESSSPGGRRRPKQSNIQENGDESRNLNYNEKQNSVQSNSSVTTSESMLSDSTEQISTITPNEEKSVEYSSPISVLDDRIHKDDSPSSLTYKVELSMDREKVLNVVEEREFGFTSYINQSKLQNIENLVQKLRRLNSSHDEATTDYIASLCENSDPDHRYISEILLASGLLLRDLGSTLIDFQFHPSGHPINPELFLVLEQTKASNVIKKDSKSQITIKGKLRRKLIFDAVNEILARKLVPSQSAEPYLRPVKLTKKAVNAQKLLRELCSEIKALQSRETKFGSEEEGGQWRDVVFKDVICSKSERWVDFDDEISGAVLDIERSIFKDLVNEILIGETAAGLKGRPVGRK